MSTVREKPTPEKSRGWRYIQSKSSIRPESTGGLLSLYIAVVAAIAVYYMFR